MTASKDTTLKVWNARTGNLTTDLPGHEDEVSPTITNLPFP